MSGKPPESVNQRRRGLVLGGLAAMFMPDKAFSLTASPGASTASIAASANAALTEYFEAIDLIHTLRRLQYATTTEVLSAQALADSIIAGPSRFVANSQFGYVMRRLAEHNPSKAEILAFLKPYEGSHIYEISFGNAPLNNAVEAIHRSISGGFEGLSQFVNASELRQKETIRHAAQKRIDKEAPRKRAVSYPPFGTAYYPIYAGEYDEAQNFYGEYELDKKNKDFLPEQSSALLRQTADYSKASRYALPKGEIWQTRLQQEAAIPQTSKTKGF